MIKTPQERPQNDMKDLLTEIHKLDWSPDASFQSGRTMVKYVTTSKIKRNLAPVLDRHGMYIAVDVCEIISTTNLLTRIRGTARLMSVDGDILISSDLISEGSSELRGVTYATTNLYRAFCLHVFSIADGMDTDDTPEIMTVPATEIHPEPAASIVTPTLIPKTQTPDKPHLSPVLRAGAMRSLSAIKGTGNTDLITQAEALFNGIETEADVQAFIAWKKQVIG